MHVEIVVSLRRQRWALPLTDGVDVTDSSDCGMPGRELLLVNEAYLVEYLLGSANSPLGGTQASSDNAHGVVRSTANEASMST